MPSLAEHWRTAVLATLGLARISVDDPAWAEMGVFHHPRPFGCLRHTGGNGIDRNKGDKPRLPAIRLAPKFLSLPLLN